MTGILAALALQAAAAGLVGGSDAAYFPRSYFDAEGRTKLQRAVMETWPGPSALLARWRKGGLSEEERVTLLLGAPAFHDPELLPMYEEAIGSDAPRERMAAAYGYRDLLGDLLPNVRAGVTEDDARLLAAEMAAVAGTLRRRSLVAMWVQVALAQEGAGLPGYRGVVFNRPPQVAFGALERLMEPEDLDLLVAAYQLATDSGLRISLVHLIEGLTLADFVITPQGPRMGWTSADVYEGALLRADGWIAEWQQQRCRISYREVVAASLAKMRVRVRDPLSPEACGVWLRVLQRGQPEWASTAARRLYACGGPWIEISVLHASSASEQEKRKSLIRWYRDSD